MDHKDILIIKDASNDFEQFYNQKIASKNIEIWHKEKLGLKKNLSSFFMKQLYYGITLAKGGWLFQIKKYKRIIIFDVAAYIIPWIRLFASKDAHIILWNWNVVSSENKRVLFLSKFCEAWTFDRAEADKFHWKLNTQFYFSEDAEIKNAEKDGEAFFVGIDKGRYPELRKVKSQLKKYHIHPSFWVVKDATSSYFSEDLMLHDKGLSYYEVLENIQKSKYIVDWVQEGQKGITVRTLEALFYKKKIITNNATIREHEIYSKDNIFIVGIDSWDDFPRFIQTTYMNIPENVIDKYTFESWLRNFDITENTVREKQS